MLTGCSTGLSVLVLARILNMQEPMSTSVLTLVKGRQQQLENLVSFLDEGSQRPDELVIALMDDIQRPELTADFPIRMISVSGEGLPLAKARNVAASAAKGDKLIFLDVDCVPSSNVVKSYSGGLDDYPDACLMGGVKYLPHLDQGVFEAPNRLEQLDAIGEIHPSKSPFADTFVREEDYGQLWGLSFALARETFELVGGFDERFDRYGGEETDFAWALKDQGVPLLRCPDALVYHQHHRVHIPPVQHFGSIVVNAQKFYQKRGRWCMDYWLGQFAEKGWIEWTQEGSSLNVLNYPSENAKEASLQPASVRYS